MEQDNASVPVTVCQTGLTWLDTQSKPQVKSTEFKLFYKVAAAILFLLMSGIGIYTYRSFTKQNAELAAIKLGTGKHQTIGDHGIGQSILRQSTTECCLYLSNELTSLDPDLMAALFKTQYRP